MFGEVRVDMSPLEQDSLSINLYFAGSVSQILI